MQTIKFIDEEIVSISHRNPSSDYRIFYNSLIHLDRDSYPVMINCTWSLCRYWARAWSNHNAFS